MDSGHRASRSPDSSRMFFRLLTCIPLSYVYRFFDQVWVNASILTDIAGKRNTDQAWAGDQVAERLRRRDLSVWLLLPALRAS